MFATSPANPANTRATFTPDRLTVLDYRGGGAGLAILIILFIILETLGIGKYGFFDSAGPASTFYGLIAVLAVNAVVIVALYRWGIPGMRPTLELYTPEMDAAPSIRLRLWSRRTIATRSLFA